MRLPLIACLALACTGAAAETAPATAIVCDNLVTLRRLMAQNSDDSSVPAEFTGCRAVPADAIGAVEKRAMIGDVPYECRTVMGASCLWVRP